MENCYNANSVVTGNTELPLTTKLALWKLMSFSDYGEEPTFKAEDFSAWLF